MQHVAIWHLVFTVMQLHNIFIFRCFIPAFFKNLILINLTEGSTIPAVIGLIFFFKRGNNDRTISSREKKMRLMFGVYVLFLISITTSFVGCKEFFVLMTFVQNN